MSFYIDTKESRGLLRNHNPQTPHPSPTSPSPPTPRPHPQSTFLHPFHLLPPHFHFYPDHCTETRTTATTTSTAIMLLGLALLSVAVQAQNIAHPPHGDTQRVVNGEEAPVGKYPWIVALEGTFFSYFPQCFGSCLHSLRKAWCCFPQPFRSEQQSILHPTSTCIACYTFNSDVCIYSGVYKYIYTQSVTALPMLRHLSPATNACSTTYHLCTPPLPPHPTDSAKKCSKSSPPIPSPILSFSPSPRRRRSLLLRRHLDCARLRLDRRALLLPRPDV